MSSIIRPKNPRLSTITMLLSAMMLAASVTLPWSASALAEKEDPKKNQDISIFEGGKGSVMVDPAVQTSTQSGINIIVDANVILDEEDCEKANERISQENTQSTDQKAGSDSKVGEGSVHISPQVQQALQVGLNIYVRTNVILAEGCSPSTEVEQKNIQFINQDDGRIFQAGEGSTINVPPYQRADIFARNDNLQTDAVIMLPIR